MAPPAPMEENLKFVLTCVHSATSNLGKIDFDAVAQDCGMNKGNTAYQRLYALKKKVGLDTSLPGSKATKASDKTGSPTKRGRPAGAGKGSPAKKQKASKPAASKSAQFEDDETEDDEGGDISEVKGEDNDADEKKLVKLKVEEEEEEE